MLSGCWNYQKGELELNPFNLKVINPFNDHYFKYAWHLKVLPNKTQSDLMAEGWLTKPIDSNSHINIYEVWNNNIFGAGVRVAVIDYNFNPNQGDIASNVIATYNVETNNTNVFFDSDSSLFHGTACASIIAAPANGIGVIGVAPQAKLILISAKSYQVGNNSADDASKIRAFEKAKEFGAKVISCSWGTLHVSQAVGDEIKSLYENNITVVFAAGNDGYNLDTLGIYDESELPTVIGVGALTQNNEKADYSNYGNNIDIYAPAGDKNFGIISARLNNRDGYSFMPGTSAATPIVVGVIALMLDVNPNLTPTQIMNIIDTHSTTSYDGYKKIDASKAVQAAIDLL